MEIDRTNQRILALLEADGRMSAAAIGRVIGLSRPAVQDRISAMERTGIIEGYHATVTESSGLVHAVLFIQIAERPCDGPLQWIQSLEGVTSVVSLAGEIDALASVTLPGMADLSALNDRIATSPLIRSSKSQIVLRRYGQKYPDR